MKVITFASLKGGSGKTTTAIATAAALIDEGQHRVFLLDLDDRQNSLYRWLIDTRRSYGEDAPLKTTLDGTLIAADVPDREAIDQVFETVVKAAGDGYDICIIDTKGTQSRVAISAMRFTDLVVIPIQVSGIEVEPFVTTHRIAKAAVKLEGARVVGLTTRMPNIASRTMLAIRDVLARHDIEIVEGTSQRDGYQQLVFETGTFTMIRDRSAKKLEEATDGKLRKRASSERDKAEAAHSDTRAMLVRLGMLEDVDREERT